jgi:hypothetical protein
VVQSRIFGAGVTSAMLTMMPCAAFSAEAGAKGTAAEAAIPPAEAMAVAGVGHSFVPKDFHVPVAVGAAGFKIVPLGPNLVKIDFDAYMSSIEHLQKTFSRSTSWPREGISDADAMQDMENEQARFETRKSFAYAVLTPDGSRERGAVYVSPSTVNGYDAIVRIWVTKAEYDTGFDAELYKWVSHWVQTEWPFEKVAYPGRAIEWSVWDAAVAANRVTAAKPGQKNH